MKRDPQQTANGDGQGDGSAPPPPDRSAKMQCGPNNIVPVYCQSMPKTLFNYRYSYGEVHGVADYAYPHCNANFMLLPVTQQARANHNVVEVAAHMGNQREWTTPGVCRCEVNWVPIRISQ